MESGYGEWRGSGSHICIIAVVYYWCTDSSAGEVDGARITDSQSLHHQDRRVCLS